MRGLPDGSPFSGSTVLRDAALLVFALVVWVGWIGYFIGYLVLGIGR